MHKLINASAHETGIADKSVHAVIFSPPYWGLRKYSGEQAVSWGEVTYAPMAGLPTITVPAMTCDLGMEPTLEAYVGHMILVMREMARVLRDDGTCWVNLGDSYSGSGKGGHAERILSKNWQPEYGNKGVVAQGLKPKDLCMTPARFALAAQSDGWYLRSEVIWAKLNCMPESVTDRPTRAHESIFLFSKSQQYFYDHEAVKTPLSETSVARANRGVSAGNKLVDGAPGQLAYSFHQARENTSEAIHDVPRPPKFGADKQAGYGRNTYSGNEWKPAGGANLRDVWHLPTASYKGAHFATYPEKLVEPMILASTSAAGACPHCGAQWRRITQKTGEYSARWGEGAAVVDAQYGAVGATSVLKTSNIAMRQTIGWQASCQCPDHEPIPAIVLDPFNGSGTTGRVANRLGRQYVGVDISKEYLEELAPERLGDIQYEMQW